MENTGLSAKQGETRGQNNSVKVRNDHRNKFSNVWLHGSVGRASHREDRAGGQEFESR